ncbi:hypothetical protein HWV62_19253 [Athelia sp. TMB]|nr:hypothetical protein HWV62_19253 [Athelia sp. TMB]
MSSASMKSMDESYPYPEPYIRQRNASPTDYGRPITRAPPGPPSQPNYGRPVQTKPRPDTAGRTSESRDPPRRTRTYSQPYLQHPPHQNGHAAGRNGMANGLPTPDSSRSTSPQYSSGRLSDVRPTRIPVHVRGRTPSISSHGGASHYNGRTSDVGPGPSFTPPGGDLYAVAEAEAAKSRSSISLPRRNPPGILSEPAPFKVGRSVSGQHAIPREDPPRQSTDSEERPFEHWYRGDVHRNGGVGELRVGAKQEMLDIANYGHRFGGKSKPASPKTTSTSRGGPEEDDYTPRRTRAGSFSDAGARESFYLDEDRARELSNVMLEDPLTDLDGDGDPDTSSSVSDHGDLTLLGSRPSFAVDDARSVTPTNHPSIERERSAPQTRIPGPAVPSPQGTPTQAAYRGGSESPAVSSSSSPPTSPGRPQNVRSASTPPEQQNRRVKSPGPASAMKKPKPKASKSPSRLKMADNPNRGSVATYPEPPAGDISNAIPSWTQPTGGNWDEVVLPVVARKKGLDDHYEEGDGNTQSKKADESMRIEPAPGTFGYDHTKYRPPRDDIPMSDFAQRPANPEDTSIAEEPESQDVRGRPSFAVKQEDDPRPAFVPPKSPAPFAHYAVTSKESGVPNILITRPTIDENVQDEHDGGCCKCVIM